MLVLDPFGNIPLVISALARVRQRQARVVLRECMFAYVILLAFMAGGRTFMQWLQLSDVALSIAGGINSLPHRAADGLSRTPMASSARCATVNPFWSRWPCRRSPDRRRSPR